MNIAVLCDNLNHPIYPYLTAWIAKVNKDSDHVATLFHRPDNLTKGDVLFLVSCGILIPAQIREKFNYNLVLHASDLPQGRGWSPHIWQILNGATDVAVSLISASDPVDTGDIWNQVRISIDQCDLYDDINHKLFEAELSLMDWALDNIETVSPYHQSGSASYYPKRTPNDSEIDVNKSIFDQWNLIRTCDPRRYPAYFVLNGQKYELSIKRGEMDE